MSLILLISLPAYSCGWKAGGDPDTITVLMEFPPDTLDPRYALSAYSKKICRLIYSALVRIGDDLRPEPDLAESIEHPDPSTYVIRLREGVTFHDGTPLTSADVKYTYESMKDPAAASPYLGFYTRIRSIETPDPRTVIFRLDGPHAPFVSDLIIGIVPKSAASLPRGALSAKPNGSGPFRMLSWGSEDLLVLGRNPGLRGLAPAASRLVFKTLRDDNTRLLSLVTGDGDMFQNAIPPLIAGALRDEGRLLVSSAPSALYTYIGFNMEDPILKDPRVRRAIAHAIDRDALIRHKFQGLARRSTGLLAPEHWAYEGGVAEYPYDPAGAEALLDEAGLRDPDGDGPRKRFNITYKTSTNKFRLGVARAIASYLEDVGIGVSVRAYEFGTFFEDIKSGNFQMYSLQWTEPVEPDLYRWIFHSKSIPGDGGGSGANRGRYRNTRLDDLLERGRVESDHAQRKAVYSEVQKILAEDLPYISLWHEDNVAVSRRCIDGFKMNPQAGFEGLLKTRKH